jgi:hypothetical protein
MVFPIVIAHGLDFHFVDIDTDKIDKCPLEIGPEYLLHVGHIFVCFPLGMVRVGLGITLQIITSRRPSDGLWSLRYSRLISHSYVSGKCWIGGSVVLKNKEHIRVYIRDALEK